VWVGVGWGILNLIVLCPCVVPWHTRTRQYRHVLVHTSVDVHHSQSKHHWIGHYWICWKTFSSPPCSLDCHCNEFSTVLHLNSDVGEWKETLQVTRPVMLQFSNALKLNRCILILRSTQVIHYSSRQVFVIIGAWLHPSGPKSSRLMRDGMCITFGVPLIVEVLE